MSENNENSHARDRALWTEQRQAQQTKQLNRALRLMYAGMASFIIAVLPAAVSSTLSDERTRLYLGAGLVVLIGALGLTLRGVGESLTAVGRPKERAAWWKALGYYLGAAAYIGATSIGLIEFVRRQP